MKFQANKKEVLSKQKWSSKQKKNEVSCKKMKFRTNKKDVPGKQKWSSR